MRHRPAPIEPSIPSRFPAPSQDVISYLFRGQHDEQIRCLLALDGRLDAGRMARAVRLMLDAEPVLGCRWLERSWRSCWERLPDLVLGQVGCHAVEAQDAIALEREMWRFVLEPMDVRAGPLVQAGIFRGDRDTLAVKIHHVAADGVGAIQYVGLLAQTYRELEANPDYRPRPNLRSRSLSVVYKHVGPLGLLASLRSLRAESTSWGFTMTGDDLSGRTFAMRRVAPERLRAIKDYGHQHGVTMNDILLTAYYRALFELLDPPYGGRYTITLPFDLRRYLPAGQALPICNFSNVVQLAITRERDATFKDTLVQVHRAMQTAKASFPGLGMSLFGEVLCLPGHAVAQGLLSPFVKRVSVSGKTTPFLSNVGVIPANAASFGDVAVVEAIGIGMVAFPPALIVTASTFREVLTLATGYCETVLERATIERFMDAVVEELP